MDNQYYTPYSEGTNVSESIGHVQPLPYAELVPQPDLETLDYNSYEDPTFQCGDVTYSPQDYLAPPIQQNLSASTESSYEYCQGMSNEEGLNMPESQRTIARERRKAQNRAAQKAFRNRKESRIKELEQRLAVVEKDYKALEEAFKELKAEKEECMAELADIAAENNSLKGSMASSPTSPSDAISRWSSISRDVADLKPFSGYQEPSESLEAKSPTSLA